MVKTTLVAATDGSALRNPSGPAGWCWYVDDRRWAAGGWKQNTNNVAELTAIAEVLDATAALDVDLVIETDSRYAIDCVTNWIAGWRQRGWRTSAGKPVKNADLIRRIDTALSGRTVRFVWVRGHSGHRRNEAADLRAVAAARCIDAGQPVQAGPGWVS